MFRRYHLWVVLLGLIVGCREAPGGTSEPTVAGDAKSQEAVPVAKASAATTTRIRDTIGAVESVQDPKCHASASRWEDFVYGTPLIAGARFANNALQTAWVGWGVCFC